MKKKRNKRLNRILAVLIIVAAVCVGGYFAFCFWVNASGMIMGKDAKVDQGSAIVVNGANRREGVFSLLGRFGGIVVRQVKEINVPCMAVSAMKKSGMMTSTAFDEACAKPAQAGDPQD